MDVMSSSSRPASKKLKRSKVTSDKHNDQLQRIVDLEKSVSAGLQSKTSLNSITDLLHVVSTTSNADVSLKAAFALYRLFSLIIQASILKNQEDEDAGTRTVRLWTAGRLNTFVDLLCQLLRDGERTLRVSSLKILFSLLRQLSSMVSSDSSSSLSFDVPFFQRIVRALLLCPSSPRSQPKHSGISGNELVMDVRESLLETWLNAYADLRWFFLRETAAILENANLITSHPFLPSNALSILEKLNGIPSSSDANFKFSKDQFWIEALKSKPKLRKNAETAVASDSESDTETNESKDNPDDWRAFFEDPRPDSSKNGVGGGRRLYTLPIHAQLHTPAAHRAVFTRAWLALLPLLAGGEKALVSAKTKEGVDPDETILVARALLVLHHGVLPYLTRAVLIMDWVGSCVDRGGYVGLLALNALFILMRDYNLDYPSFYTRLYAFLDRSVLHTPYRARFFRLTELFLSSSHLPATLLASFVKRLARLSLSAPPAGVIIVAPLVYSILKRHPALMCMIHRVHDSNSEKEDPFDEMEPEPTLTNALGSSLWELAGHGQHFYAPAATLARIFEEPFTRPSFAMEDFLDHTYATLFDTEANQRLKREPAVLEDEFEQTRQMVIRSGAHEDPNSPMQMDAISSMWVFV